MSRRSYKASYVPSVTPHSRIPPKDTASSRRRSARLAAQNGEDFPDHSVSTQFPSHAIIKSSQARPRRVDPAMERAKVAPRSLRGQRSTNQSGLFSENGYGQDEKSLTHLYGEFIGVHCRWFFSGFTICVLQSSHCDSRNVMSRTCSKLWHWVDACE